MDELTKDQAELDLYFDVFKEPFVQTTELYEAERKRRNEVLGRRAPRAHAALEMARDAQQQHLKGLCSREDTRRLAHVCLLLLDALGRDDGLRVVSKSSLAAGGAGAVAVGSLPWTQWSAYRLHQMGVYVFPWEGGGGGGSELAGGDPTPAAGGNGGDGGL